MTTENKAPEALYVSGPMSNIPEHNFPLFNQVAAYLRREGYEVYNPAEHFGGRTDLARQVYMLEDFRILLEMAKQYPSCGLVMLPGWERSYGAVAEAVMAMELGFKFYRWDNGTLVLIPDMRKHIAEVGMASIRKLLPDNFPGTATTAAPAPAPGEVRITDPKTGGQKGMKPERLDLIPRHGLEVLSRVYGYGAAKYADHNWRKGYKWSLSYAAMQRHLIAFWDGEDNDKESGLPHLGHAAFHCFALMGFMDFYKTGDDRYALPRG